MATSAGAVTFGVTIDASRIATEIQAALTPALATIQRKLNATPLQVKIDIDVAGELARAQTALNRARLRIPTVNLDIDTVGAIARAQTRLSAANFGTGTVTVPVDVDAGMAMLQLRALHAIMQNFLRDNPLVVHVELNAASALAQVRALHELMQRALPPLRQEVNVDVDRGVLSRVSSLRGGLSGIALTAGGIGTVAAVLAGIGGAAAIAAGAIGGLVAGMAAIGPAAAAIGATAFVGLSGIKDAFTSLSAVSKNSAAESASQSKAIASAQDQVASSLDGAKAAQRGLVNAQRESASAARDVGQAYKDAERELSQYSLTVREASLDERDAAAALDDARRAANQLTFDPREREKAARDVERAEINLARAQDKNRETQQKFTEAQQKGVEGSDKVVAAKEKQRQADEAVTTASAGVASANRSVATAQRALQDATESATPSVLKFNEAMAKLSPNAQGFVLAARALGPAWKDLQNSIQDQLFAGLDKTLANTANVILPVLKTAMGGVATQLNSAATQALNFTASAKGIEGLNAVFANGANLLKGLTGGTGEFTKGLIDASVTATPLMEGLGRSIASLGEGIGRAFSRSAASGELTKVFEGLSGTLQGLGGLLDTVLGGLLSIGAKVLPTLKPLLDALSTGLGFIIPALGDLGKIFSEQLALILPDLGRLIGALAQGLKPVLPILAKLLDTVFQALTPLMPEFSRIVQILGKVLIDTIKALEPALGPLVKAFGDLLNAVAPIIPLIAENFATVITELAPALSDLFDALAPVIQTFTEQMKPVMDALAPVLKDVATTLGQAMSDAIGQIAPILPGLIKSFADFFIAILPILPPLIKLGTETVPILVGILVQFSPIIIGIIEAMTWFVRVTIEQLTPAINGLSDVFTAIFSTISDGISWLTGTAFPKIGEALGVVKGWFSGTVDGIRTIWDGLKSFVSDPINFIINTVWNNGLLKAWNTVRGLLGGSLPEATPLQVIPARAMGGPIPGRGGGTADDVLMWGSSGEHMVTAAEVIKAGGQNVIFAIRDMIARGVPFTWDNGNIVSDLGKGNLQAYGAQVAAKGIGNVPPEGLFDQLLPKFQGGGPVMPWMNQLQKGHEFARAQHGKPYQWAGPRFVGDSFDCSGFMASIAAAILGGNPWQRYWSTQSFAGYPSVGPQGFTRNLRADGMLVGVTNDPGGPGGGHTAGVLGPVPLLGIPNAMRVESGGALGNVHYGTGTDPFSFASQYGLPIGANGFFQPGAGMSGGPVGPSTDQQSSFLTRQVERIVHAATAPVRNAIKTTIGEPPPSLRGVPPGVLNATEGAFVKVLTGSVGKLGSALGGAWQRATDLGDKVLGGLGSLNPFDAGGVASGTGFMPKNVIAPERILSPEQTKLFEALVTALQSVAGGAGVAGSGLLTASTFQDGIASLGKAIGIKVPDGTVGPVKSSFLAGSGTVVDENGAILSDTKDLLERTASSQALVDATRFQQTQAVLTGIANLLTEKILVPVIQAGMEGAFKSISADATFNALGRSMGQVAGQIVAAAVAASSASKAAFAGGGVLPGYTPGRDIHQFYSPTGGRLALSGGEAIMRPEWTRSVGGPAGVARLNRAAAHGLANGGVLRFATGGTSPANLGSDLLNIDQSTVFGAILAKVVNVLVTALLKVIGIEIQVRDTMNGLAKDIRAFKGDTVAAFDENGQLISDTSGLVERTVSSQEEVESERNRITKEIISGTIKYLITTVLVPVLQALSSSLISASTTAIGGAIGGPAGAIVGSLAGAALGGLSTVLIGALGAILSAGIDAAFDSGGVASGVGLMPKRTLAPERVLSPRQTEGFERMVAALESGQLGRTIINAPMNVSGDARGAQVAHSGLLALLNS